MIFLTSCCFLRGYISEVSRGLEAGIAQKNRGFVLDDLEQTMPLFKGSRWAGQG